MKANAYNFSNDLARIGGALKNAFIGSASDDANIALAKYRDSQTEGQAQQNEFLGKRNQGIAAASGPDGIIANRVANALGITLNENNIPLQTLAPGAPLQSIPAFPNQVNRPQASIDAELSGLARAIFGDGTYTPNQLTSAFNDLTSGADSNLARSMLLDPATSSEAQRRAALVLNQDQFVNMDNNAADNIASGERNTADNTQSGANNAADNIASGERNTADNAQSGANNAADNIASGERNTADNAAAADKPSADTRNRPSVKDTNANWTAITDTVDGYDDLPTNVKGKLRTRLLKSVDIGMSANKQASYDAVYAQAVTEPLLAGTTNIAAPGPMNDFAFPSYFYQQLFGKPEAFIKSVARELGYNDKQAQQVADQVLAQ